MRPASLVPLVLAFVLAGPARGQTPPADVAATTSAQPAAKAPVTVFVGVYIRRIDELDFKTNVATVSYFVWARCT